MTSAGSGDTRLRRAILALTPLLLNVAIGLSLRLVMPYTLVESGERYRYYAMSLFFPMAGCLSFHCFRILPPALTSLLPFEVIDSFLVTGFVFQVLAGVMVWLIAEQLHQSRRVAAYAVAWYWVTWAPMQVLGDPLLITDPVAAFWSFTALYLLLEQRYVPALLVLMTGAAVKESVLLVPLIYGAYTFLANDPARRRIVWLAVLAAAPLAAWLLLRQLLSSRFGYVSYEDESYVRQTYFFGFWLPNLAEFPKNLLIAAIYIFGACGAAWVLGPLGLRHANRRQRALTFASLPAMVFLALYQVPDRALASFPYAIVVPAAIMLSRLPSMLSVALLVANAAFSIRMNTAVPWLPRVPLTIGALAVLTIVAVWLDARTRSRPAASVVAAPRPARPAAAWVATMAILACTGAASLHAWRAHADHQTLTWSPSPPFLVDDEGQAPSLAVSPDGEWVAFVACHDPADCTTRRLWRRRVGSPAATALVGTDGAGEPFWSPDGGAVGFFADGKLKTLDLSSGVVTPLTAAPIGRGGAWHRDGVIVFAPDLTGGLSQVAATGGPAAAVTTLERGEQSHRWPSFLPDGRHVVFTARGAGREGNGVYLGTLGSAERRRICDDNSNAAYAGPGFLLIARDDGLWRQPFDRARLRPFGDREKVAAMAFTSATGRGAFALSDHVLVFAGERGPSTADPKSHLEWVDERGRRLGVERSIAMPAQAEVSHGVPVQQLDRLPDGGIITSRSPDGRVVLYQKQERKTPEARPGGWNVWIQPLARGSEGVPLAGGRNDVQAQFSPDGRWIAYTSDDSNANEVYVQPYPQTGERWKVSIDGGAQPRWRSAGEIVYVADDRFVRAVSFDAQQPPRVGLPRQLFEMPLRPADPMTRLFQFAADGGKFLVNVADTQAKSGPITIVSGWAGAYRLQ